MSLLKVFYVTILLFTIHAKVLFETSILKSKFTHGGTPGVTSSQSADRWDLALVLKKIQNLTTTLFARSPETSNEGLRW